MPYYSKKEAEKGESTIYHECKNCIPGKNIKKENLKIGLPLKLVLYRTCQELIRIGKCIRGTPESTK